jgi:FtsP/CotA-like multicopper oxidase with cupredoxin domain
MSTLNGAYANTILDSAGTGLLEVTLTATPATLSIGGGVTANVEVFNGEIPGPTLKLTVGDRVIVRLINDLTYPLGIHWHGIELENYSDGTEVTQNAAAPFGAQTILGATAGGTFLYKFKVTRAGLFWYHPHHGMSMNRVFRGMYGMIIVTDPGELTIPPSVLPTDSVQLVLSDITVCKTPASMGNPSQNDVNTYDFSALPAADQPEWLSGVTSQGGAPQQPLALCETSPKDDDGNAAASPYNNHDVPSLMGQATPQVEGQTVLTNGVNVGGRNGKPLPGQVGTLSPSAVTRNVLSGQGLRLQIVNCAHLRYFRLFLTRQDGTPVPLVRIGGEAGLLDNAILEGGTIGTINTGYFNGEILLATANRADVVVAIPTGLAGTVLTLWTRDYKRTGGNLDPNKWADLPTVPVMHLNVTGSVPVGTEYSITANPIGGAAGTALRSAAVPPMPAVAPLPAANDILFLPPGKVAGVDGSSNQNIQLTTAGTPRIDGADPTNLTNADYFLSQHIASTRYAKEGKILELTVQNTSTAHHPFHLHGFSFQPISSTGSSGSFTWGPFHEFRDTIDLFPGNTLTFRVRLDDRKLADGSTDGGNLGRWLFHCHIFFHHMRGMISELVVVSNATSKEKPDVTVGGSWAYAPSGGTATRDGRFHHPDGLNITLTASTATLPSIGSFVPPVAASPNGTWHWEYTGPDIIDYVYITATDSDGRKDQAVFRLQVGGADQGGDHGDVHIRTMDGTRYDFQAAGEFVLIRDLEGMEVQTRQAPAVTPPPVKDDYSGLTECVSLNSAAAARVGPHRISYQPWREPGRLQFFLDGKEADLPKAGLDLEGHRVTTFDAAGETGIRIDYAHGPVVKITPNLWTSYGIHYLDVDVSNTDADQGLMGSIHPGTWLPNLPSGANVGPRPASLHDRYVTLYKTFADAWRLTDATSMFEYTPGKSTASFTDKNWPPQKPPCTTLAPGFPLPVHPIKENIPISRAKQICKDVKLDDLHANCVFDVATTGDPSFAKGYLIAQELRLCGTAVQIVGDKPRTQPGELLVVTATVLPRTPGRPIPTGSVTFIIDGVPIKTKLDKRGRARFKVADLNPGEHKIRATYSGGGKCQYHPSSSPNLLHTVTRENGGGYTVTKPGGDMMPMGDASTRGRGSDAGPLHTVVKKKKPARTTGRAHKKNR